MASGSSDPIRGRTPPYEMELEGKDDRLRRSLDVHPPEEASRTPPILAFTRKREIEIPWGEIVPKSEEARADSALSTQIREYFEQSWDIDDFGKKWLNDPEHDLMGDQTPCWRVRELKVEAPVFRANLDGNTPPTKLAAGFVIRHGTSGRVYHLNDPANALGEHSFNSWDGYVAAWRDHIEGVELVFEAEADAKYCMDFEEIDLRPALIQRTFKELSILLKFATTVRDKVKGVTGQMIDKVLAERLDADELEQLQRKVTQLDLREFDVQRRIERLASDAARLGYVLVIRDDVKVEEQSREGAAPTQKTLEKGKLYTTCQRTARWTEYVPTRVRVGWSIFSHMKTVQVPRPKEEVFVHYEEVDTSKDPLEEKRSELRKEYQVYVFVQTPDGLVSTEGEPLQQIMDRCGYDEVFRRGCAVVLPVHEQSLTGHRALTKYSIYKRPLPGMTPAILPRLSIEESLTYRTAWLGTQLGELVSTINLAPDEERKVTITKRFEQETTTTRASTSIFDVSRAETTDLATEMENQARHEQESSKSMQFSTKASGGYGPFSAEASASGGTSSSLKDVSQAISRVARKAAKSVSSQNRQEVSAATTSRTTVSNMDETVATIRNTNKGRSLNLMLYRLYNKYKGGLYLEDLRFDVVQSVEAISGSGVHQSKSFSLEELPRLIGEFKENKLPFTFDDTETYTDHLLHSIESLLHKEYAAGDGLPVGPLKATGRKAGAGGGKGIKEEVAALAASAAAETGTSVARLKLGSPGLLQGVRASPAGTEGRLARLSDDLRQAAIDSGKPIAPQELLVAAAGLYLDVAVGAQSSTEPYSEPMRPQEGRMREAEIPADWAEAPPRQAMAMRLANPATAGSSNRLDGVMPAHDWKSLTLSLETPLGPGDWRLQVDGREKGKVKKNDLDRDTLTFSWNEPQPWLSSGSLLTRIALVNKEGNAVAYPVWRPDRPPTYAGY